MAKRKIVVVGTGYVGLPTALMLAKAGLEVVGVDINENVVKAINERVLLINEAELKTLMAHESVRKHLVAQTAPAPADAFLIAVPTPVDPLKKTADLSYVLDAVRSVAPHLKKGNLVILESTVPPMTCRKVLKPMIEELTGLKVPGDVRLAHCPERILPGNIFQEIISNHRLMGGMDEASARAASEIYSSFVKGELYLTDDLTAELCKLMENTYRDVNIALANEFSLICEDLGVDAKKVFEYANKHPRVKILKPGIGVGGHCIPVDPWFLKEVAPERSRLISIARTINDEMPHRMAKKIRQAVNGISGPVITVLGAAYKKNSEDTRESPAIEIVNLLKKDGCTVRHFDPLVPGMKYPSLAEAAAGADLLVVLVAHDAVIDEWKREREAVLKKMRRPRAMLLDD